MIAGGHAYVTQDGIYYRVATFANYGKLANRNIDELEAGARIEVDENKEDPLDFALWKFAKPGEPRWPFEPYGAGPAGLAYRVLGDGARAARSAGTGFDIHGGGADLIFPHHENEIAQSEPLMARPPMANFWAHGGLLLFDNRKMAKSLGNFEPLSELLERHDPQAIRWLFLQTGYRKVMNFTEDSIAAAGLGLARVKAAYRDLAPATDGEPVESPELDRRMEAALDDDMNTAAALAVLYDVVARSTPSRERLAYWLGVLGVAPTDAVAGGVGGRTRAGFRRAARSARCARHRSMRRLSRSLAGTRRSNASLALRSEARSAKDWSASDRLRDALQRCGVELKDSKEDWTSSERRRRLLTLGERDRATSISTISSTGSTRSAKRSSPASGCARFTLQPIARRMVRCVRCSRKRRNVTCRFASSSALSSTACRSKRIRASWPSHRPLNTRRCTRFSAQPRGGDHD